MTPLPPLAVGRPTAVTCPPPPPPSFPGGGVGGRHLVILVNLLRLRMLLCG